MEYFEREYGAWQDGYFRNWTPLFPPNLCFRAEASNLKAEDQPFVIKKNNKVWEP